MESLLQQTIRKAAKVELSRRSFWEFCKTLAPDFYFDERTHLKTICNSLQALYEGRIVKYLPEENWRIVAELTGTEIVCKKLMMNIPPQHGKTRTLTNFSAWIFGKNKNEKIIAASYNDSTASDFSRYTRDAIDFKSTVTDQQLIYSDIFPETKIKRGNASFEKWAIEGCHFSYIGVGIGGSVTSKGGSILIVDDPVKSAEDALNENNLERIWLWYTSTFKSRVSAKDGEPLEIMNMTLWSKNDPCGKILESETAKDWYRVVMRAYDEATDTMLCPSMLSKKRFLEQKVLMEPGLFNANYQQEALDKKGVLFKRVELKIFKKADFKEEGCQSKLGYIDVADEGDDALAFACAKIFPKKVFITDVIFSTDNIDITEPRCAGLINKEKLNYVRIETNNQGGGFKRTLSNHVQADKLLGVKSTTNKLTRILMQYGFIKEYFYFLDSSEYEPNSEYAKFMEQVYNFMKDGSSKHDDAPDSLAGLSNMIQSFVPHLFK